jgi:hypothetical protein
MKRRVHARTVMIVGIMLAPMLAGGCVGGIDESLTSPITNNDAYATIGYLWNGARDAIVREREPSTNTFTIALNYGLPCTRGGSGTYRGTLAGTKASGIGSAQLAVTGVLSSCQFDEITSVRVVAAPAIAVSGSVAIAGDTWSTINVRLVASTVTINGVSCPGGVDVVITGASLSSQATSTGTACGRTGAVALP